MFCVNIRISPETEKKYGLTEDSAFEIFYDAPLLKVRQLSEEEVDELCNPESKDCDGCPLYCRKYQLCVLDQI